MGNTIAAQKSYDFSMEIFSLVIRVILTIGIEVIVAILFRYKDKKSVTIIGLTNKARHPVMYAALANLVSIVVGIRIAKAVPGIF